MVKIFRSIALFALFTLASTVKAQTVTVTWTDVHQTIDGFGAAASWFQTGNSNLAANMNLFFNKSTGAGYSILRVEIPYDGSCATVNPSCAGDITSMKAALAINPELRILATPWSPPASMKTNSDTSCTGSGGNGTLSPGSYAAYASYLANYVKSVAAQGITLYALSVQNEPEVCPGYPGALWTGVQINIFIKNNLGPTFAAAGITTKIMLPEAGWTADLGSFADPTMTDGSTVGYVGLVATHDYGVSQAAQPVTYTTGGKNFWETEVSDGAPFDATMTSGLVYAKEIHDWMAGSNLNAWLFWWLIGANGDNEGLIDNASAVVAKRLYTIGNFSKFVRPGWVRIAATANPQAGVYVTAYKNVSAGDFAIVAINLNGSGTSQTFSLSGFTSTLVTPWITSGSLNLAQESNIPVVSNAFSATLPAWSVTTFVGSAGSGPAPPAITGIIAH